MAFPPTKQLLCRSGSIRADCIDKPVICFYPEKNIIQANREIDLLHALLAAQTALSQVIL